jgi:hypothetical protein
METNDKNDQKEIPSGQKLLDSPFKLLFLGMVVMLVFYTIWGFFEVTNLTKAPLP